LRATTFQPARPRIVAFVQTQAENASAQEVARQLAHGAARWGDTVSFSRVGLWRRAAAATSGRGVGFRGYIRLQVVFVSSRRSVVFEIKGVDCGAL
jgi:hypothetical protein